MNLYTQELVVSLSVPPLFPNVHVHGHLISSKHHLILEPQADGPSQNCSSVVPKQ